MTAPDWRKDVERIRRCAVPPDALDSIEERLADLEQVANEWELIAVQMQTRAEAAERERDALQHIIDCADTPLMRDVLRERDELEAALRGIQGWIESEFREGDKEFQVALACRAALASGKDKP